MNISHKSILKLAEFLESNKPLLVLTGAGCSTDSGIPVYRDKHGNWKYRQPVQYQDFTSKIGTRKRYWAGSMVGWSRISRAVPNPAHYSLSLLERNGFISYLVTQNVDGLHQKAGSMSIMDLHGKLDAVVCVNCELRMSRTAFQKELLEYNPSFKCLTGDYAPDGDALPDNMDINSFQVPECPECRGVIKPDVVFFGEQVPRDRVSKVNSELGKSRALLVIGSSLMVHSGYRFCKYAIDCGKPVAILNPGKTRADANTTIKVELPCNPTLEIITSRLIA